MVGCRWAVDTFLENLESRISWYSNVYGGLIRWKRRRILQGDGWWNSEYYEKVQIIDCFKEVSCWSQCASKNIVFQVQDETWLDNQEIQSMILCEMGCPEDTVSWTPELVFSIGKVGHSEVNVYFSVYSRFVESKYLFYKCLFSGRYFKWGASIRWNSHIFQEWWRTIWCCSHIKESLYGQAKAARL